MTCQCVRQTEAVGDDDRIPLGGTQTDLVRAITTSCGFLAKLQADLAAAVRVPVVTSSLLLVPLVSRMLMPGRAVGILTIEALALSAEHLTGAGIGPELHVAVVGLDGGSVARSILEDRLELDGEAARAEHRAAARRLVGEHPDVGAIVLECANMPPYRAEVEAETGLPVFDFTHVVRLLHCGAGSM